MKVNSSQLMIFFYLCQFELKIILIIDLLLANSNFTEKEDLVNLLLIFANGTDPRSRPNERLGNTPHNPPRENRTEPTQQNRENRSSRIDPNEP